MNTETSQKTDSAQKLGVVAGSASVTAEAILWLTDTVKSCQRDERIMVTVSVRDLDIMLSEMRHRGQRLLICDAALTACHSAMLGNVKPTNPAWGVLHAAQDSALQNS